MDSKNTISIALIEKQKPFNWTINKINESLLMTNNEEINLTENFKNTGTFYSKIIDLEIRTATSNQYAVFVTQMSSGDENMNNTNIFVINGVIDSGYRGIVKALVYYRSTVKKINPYDLKIKLLLLELSKDLIPVSPKLHSLDKHGELNFFNIFNKKRDEDAGYDIPSPRMVRIEPGYSYLLSLPIFQLEMKNPPIACIFGRSSLNSSGIIVLPTIWKPKTLCQFFIKNISSKIVTIEKGQRIAQLVLLKNTQQLWLQPQINCHSLFPKTNYLNSSNQEGDMWKFTEDLDIEAPRSLRGINGFGSTGL
ncbi:deoxyuridine triphosphatase [Canid alphaherpesvirus 1]|nr:deoxyuridine triphosphatase [Canid alphaherpesvirus 1]QQL08462.1 deoxyuridine triphosphatase [Canid alphaherpesvirus 1]WHU31580.1 deoxyuridine triphosphatase [Canid alphaherpesvirus 1]WHU31654.1 deoxyuridine triphosphatase [Canid alphaherpesvirus 1]